LTNSEGLFIIIIITARTIGLAVIKNVNIKFSVNDTRR
jgi:hypothetical protein